MLNNDEKAYLRSLIERDLEQLKRDEHVVLDSPALRFIKGEQEYMAFIENLLEKLK